MSSSVLSAGCSAAARLVAIAGGFVFVACSQQLPPRSTLDLMHDPAVLQGVLLRCNHLQGAALRDAECRNAREAVERLAAEDDEHKQAAAAAAEKFEKAREARRARDEEERRHIETGEQVDPYTMPLVPEQPTTSAPATAAMSATSPPTG